MRLQNWRAPGQSLQSRAVNGFLSTTWRPISALVPDNRIALRLTRGVIARGMALGSPIARGTAIERVESSTDDGLIVRGEWVRNRHASSDGAILYVHGSGYVVCSSRTHRGLTSRISADTGMPVFSVDYRLAPSHQYPAAQQDVRAAWEWLLDQGIDSSRVIVAGDSAGGHLAITLCLELAREGRPLPAGIVALSPVIDLALEAGGTRDRIERDPFVAPVVARRALASYADETAQGHDGLRITFEDLDAFPPALIHAGSRELLAADSTELVRRLRGAGFEAQYRVWPGQMHVFQAMTAVIPESHIALAEIAHFVSTHVPAATEPELKAVPA